MNKKKLFLTIIIDMLALAAFFASVYVLMCKDLNRWQNNLATGVAVIALPVFFYSIFTSLAFKKYGDMQRQDIKRWDKEDEEVNSGNEEEA